MIGNLFTTLNHYEYYQPTIPYLNDKIVYCLRNPDLFPRWLYLISVTDSVAIWYIGIIAILLTVGAAFLYGGFEKNQMNIFDAISIVYGATLGVSVPIRKYTRKTTVKIICGLMLLSLLALIQIYNAFFYNILLNIRYLPKIKSFQYIIDNEYDLITTPSIAVIIFHHFFFC